MPTPGGRNRSDHNQHKDRSVAPTGSALASSERRKERGEVTASAVVMIPLVMLMMFAIVQVAIGWHAKSALEAAAEDGLRAAQTSSVDQARGAATQSAQMNAGFVADLSVNAIPTSSGRLTVTVRGQVPGPIPGMRWTITARASGPLELFRVQGQS
jgi:Flp pilus assembly protein TadG